MHSEFNTFLAESSQKNTDLTEICLNKCDFSTLYSQQLTSFVYSIGGFIENSK